MLGKITGQNFQPQQDSQKFKDKGERKREERNDNASNAPGDAPAIPFPSLSSANLANILEQLNGSPYYQNKRLSFRLIKQATEPREEVGDGERESAEWNEIEVLKLDDKGLLTHVQNLSLERLFKLWVHHKLFQKAPQKGGLLNVSC